MALGGICESCRRFSPGLFTCKACGKHVCPNCVMEGSPFCIICKGRKTVGSFDKKQVRE